MAKVYLDTNYFIDLVEGRTEIDLATLEGHSLYISPLSIHVLVYVYKYSVPNKKLTQFTEFFTIVPLDAVITEKALIGPTKDFEDNIQLQTAAISKCDIFLTRDKKLIDTAFFGVMQIKEAL